eukprot:370160_1
MLHQLTLFTILKLASASYPPLPGQEFILAGYDYIKGNPMEWETIDPGYKDDVFTGVVNSSSQSIPFGHSDYSLYSGLSGKCGLTCGAIYKYTSITGIQEYYDMLEEHVSISKKGLFSSFSMSETYKKINQGIQINKNVAANTFQQCVLCSLSVNGFGAGPPLSLEMTNAIKEMPTTTNNEWFYTNFMPHFGTHYVSNIQLGAIYGMLAIMDKYSYEEFDSSNLDIEVSASALANSLAGCEQTQTEKQEAHYFHSVTISADTYNMGASLPPNMSSSAWQSEIEDKKEVGPTHIEISPLTDLVSNSQKKAALASAINGYCAWLKKNEDSSLSCSSLPPNGPGTDRGIWKGVYIPPNNSPIVGKNPYTQPEQSNCPAHFKPFNWLQDAQGNNVWIAYMCLNSTIMSSSKKDDPLKMFGGFWMTGKNGNGCTYGNPMNNGQCDCVSGYAAMKVYTYCMADGQMISGYVCLNTAKSPSQTFIGGFYQSGYFKLDNYWTHGTNCPSSGHQAYPVAENFVCNGKSSNDKCSLYVCLSNIYPVGN